MKIAYRTFFLATSLLAVAHNVHAQNRAKHIAAVINAEKAFSQMSVDTAVQVAFDHFLTTDAYVFRPRAVRAAEYGRRNPLPRELVLAWEPEYADVSRAGDLGYTTGMYATGSRRERVTPMFGQYLTIWRRQSNGSYRAVFNGAIRTPTRDPKATKSPPAASPYIGKASASVEKASLLKADNNFAAAAKQRGYTEALRPIAHADIRVLRNTIFESTGMDSIARTHRGARISMWTPAEAVTAKSGDLGYTRGSYVISMPNGSNEAGDYVRMWRRDTDGTWRVTLDIMSPGR